MKKNILLLALVLLAGVACQTLLDTGRIIARPALTILVQQLVQDSSEWGAVIRIVNTILDEALHSSPPSSPFAVEAAIERLVGSFSPGTHEQREAFMSEINATLRESYGLAYGQPPEPVDGIRVLGASIKLGLDAR